ncbi:hypothetical protein PACTADRAFT_5178 [Pachysolen tannophilus NRRL Y-2460]|uniref:Uncharacterized protein n=1 Tax=Pachysolen tannophilus NRRL Y-2460 TaxID=669874 RepID=A0A1E4TNQ2_PACTA|nr:hypothetical protein PACTADRAFT_5178 [Pachysolen tannophilus NRRL Y-2460]
MKKSLISHELKSVRQLAFRRSVSISQLSSTGNSSRTTSINFDVNNNGSNGVEEITLNVPDSANPQFQKMGNTSSLLSFNLPPSVPVYIKNGSLVSLYGSSISGKKTNNSISSVTSQLEIISPIKRFFYGGFTSSYKKLISTVPFNVLVSTDSRKNFLSRLFIKTSVSEKSFVNLSLDGRIDWAVFPTRA